MELKKSIFLETFWSFSSKGFVWIQVDCSPISKLENCHQILLAHDTFPFSSASRVFRGTSKVNKEINLGTFPLSAVQHERGPRKPKLQHLHNQMAHQQHHHHHHHGGFNPMSVNAASYAHHNLQSHHAGATHFTQLNSFQQHATILHHPQPLSFGTLLHPTPLLPNSGMPNQHSSLSSGNGKYSDLSKMPHGFDFPSINSNFYKPLSQQLQQFSPTNSKSTISIDSSSASSVSDRIMSPHSTVDSHCGNNATPPVAPISPAINKSSVQITSGGGANVAASFSASSASSVSSFTAVTNGNAASSQLSQQTTRANMQNGLLDILMSPDKYQELIQYHQAQNSIIFPSLHHAAYQIDALNPRLPTWEFLQVGDRRENVAMMLRGCNFNKGT